MKRLLLVDDDAVVTRAYRDRLAAHGFQVNTAAGGAKALSILRCGKPDLVVLDLMMPDLSGVEVLRYIRSVPKLAPTPVVLLTSNYQNELGREAARIGIEKAFLKAQCSPSVLMAAIDEILEPGLAAAKPPEPAVDAATSLDAPAVGETSAAPPDQTAQAGSEEPTVEAGASLLANAPAISADLGHLFEALAREVQAEPEREDHLQELFCKVHFLAEVASQTQLAMLAQTTAAFEALLRVLVENPKRFKPSVLRTLESLVEFVGLLFQRGREPGLGTPLSARVLVVDNDPIANRLVVAALRQAQLNATGTEDSLAAWQWINSEHFDLVLLDNEMPVLSGLELCKRLRTVAGYEKTAVLLVTVNDDPDSRARSTQSGADDLVVKSDLPQELAAKVVMHLLRARMQA